MSFEGYLEQNSTTTITIGPFVDKDDGDTEKIGLTVQDTDVYLSKNGGAKGNPNDTSDCTEDANGIYRKQLNGTDLNTVGLLAVYCHFTDCLYLKQTYLILDPEAYAGIVTGTAFGSDDKILISANAQDLSSTLNVDAKAISGSTVAADNLKLQYDTTGLTGDTFPATQQQLGRIALAGAAVNTPAIDAPNGFIITWGENEANDEDSTHAEDGTYHDIEAANDTGTEKIEAYYEFSIGGDGIPESVTWKGYLNKGGGANKNITVQAYNWTTWDQIGSISSGTSNSAESFTLFTSHVGTGANIGKVRIRFVTGSVPFSATTLLKTDQIFLSYAIVTRSVGYANGKIWIDTSLSNTNTESFVDGTADNPVSTWAAALTLSGQLNITHFHIANGSTITLTGNSDNYVLEGHEWTLALDGQSCDDAAFTGAHVTGTCTGSEVIFNDCDLASGGGTLTCAGMEAHGCAIAGSIVFTTANTYVLDKCYSAIAGTSTPDLDFGAAVGDQDVNFRHYSGGIEIKNMGRAGTDKMSLEGWGQLILNSNCDPSNNPEIAIRGHFTITDNVAGGFVSGGGTISDDARYDTTQITASVPTAAAIVDDWETQSQADPTGFQVNVKEVNGTAQTANDNGEDINAIKAVTDNLPNSGALTDIDTSVNNIEGKLPTNFMMGSSDQTDKNDEIDAIKAKTDNLPADPASETNVDANETKIDALPTAVQNRQEMDSNSTQLAAIVADTNELQGDWTNGGRLDALIDAIKAVTDNLPDSGALNDLAAILADTNELQADWTDGGRLDVILDAVATPAQVNAECLDVLNVDTYAEPGQGTPPASPTIRQMVHYLFKITFNKSIVDKGDGEVEFFNRAGGVVDHVRSINDDGTEFTSGTVGSGP